MSLGDLNTNGQGKNNYPYQFAVVDLLSRIKDVLTGTSSSVTLVKGKTSDITTTADTSVISAPGSGLSLKITQVLVTNSHASVGTFVNLKDSSGAIYTGYATSGGGGFTLTFPFESPLTLAAASSLIAACETSGANVRVSASGYQS